MTAEAKGAAKDDMALPAGFTCADCVSYQRCQAFIGHDSINDKQTRCDWAPSRFGISKVALQRRVDIVTEENAALRRALEESNECLKLATAWVEYVAAVNDPNREELLPRFHDSLGRTRACLAAISQTDG